MSCNMLSLKRFMHVAVNASSSEIRVPNDYNELTEYQLITIYTVEYSLKIVI